MRIKGKGGGIKKQKDDDLLRWYFCIPPKRPQRITAGLRIAPPFGRRLGLGSSATLSRRLQRDRSATVAPVLRLSRRPTLRLVTALACAIAAPSLRVRKPAGRYTQWQFWGG